MLEAARRRPARCLACSQAGKCAPGEAFAGGGRAQLLGYVQMFATEDSEAGGQPSGQLACHMAVRMDFEQRLLPRGGGGTAWQLVSFFGDVVWNNAAGPLDATEGVALDGPCGADMYACVMSVHTPMRGTCSPGVADARDEEV